HSPCAGRIIAVLIPITSPRVVTRGPPELPGLSDASVCSTSSINLPDRERSERPSALTTPAVTECWNPYGFPMAIATWPTRTDRESPSVAHGNDSPWDDTTRTTARSVSASAPTRSANIDRPSGIATVTRPGRSTTWLLVRMRPSGVKQTPEPPPCSTSILTTAGPTASTARMTACEYASSSSLSSTGRGWVLTFRSYEPRSLRDTTQTGSYVGLGARG